MSSYQYTRYHQQQQLPYTSKGGRSWSWTDTYGHKKPSGTYGNATGYSFNNGGGQYGYYGPGGGSYSNDFGYSSFGGGSLATSAKGQFRSGGYDGDPEYQSGGRHGSNDFSGGQWRSGGCKTQTYANNVRIFACSVMPSYQSETHFMN